MLVNNEMLVNNVICKMLLIMQFNEMLINNAKKIGC